MLVGGDAHGANPAVQNANATYFGANAGIKADALGNGNGGKAIVWLTTLRAYGSISAKGGTNGGDGGFVETSGHRYLNAKGARVNASASHGSAGQWLLDPTDINIIYGGSVSGGWLIGGVFAAGADTATVADTDINSALSSGTSVTINTSSGYGGQGNITVYGTADIVAARPMSSTPTAARSA